MAMSISLEMIVNLLSVVITGGGILWKLSDRLKCLELNQQANAAQIEGSIRDVEGEMRQGFARIDERNAALTARVDNLDENAKVVRESISKVHSRVDIVQEKVVRLEAHIQR